MTTTPFTTFAFPASGAPSPAGNRNMPDRLAEIKNVKDFGAVGTGSVNDGPAIQAAVDWTTGPNRGTIFFPAGFYTINAPITFNYDPAPGQPGLSIRFAGEGAATFLNGSGFSGSTGYTLDRKLATPNNTASVIIENMAVGFSGGQGSIRVGSCNSVAIRNVSGSGITTEDSPGNSSQNIFIQTCSISSPGLIMGGSGVIQGCDWISCDVAARLYGNGWAVYGNRQERCNTVYLIGLDSGVAATFTGSIAHTGTNDGSGILTVASGLAGALKPLQAVSDGGANIPGGIFIVSQLSGTTGGVGTYALSNPTVTVPLQTITTIGNDVGASGFAIHGGSQEGNWNDIIYAGTCSGFYHGSQGCLGHDSGNAGATPGIIASQYHLIVGPNVSNGVFQSMFGIGDLTKVAACKIYPAGARANILFLSCDFSKGGSGSGFDWDLPNNAYTASWLNCNISPTWTYSQLPTGGNVLEGDQFTITDSTTATWGASVTTGGGGTRVLVRWNGSNWTVIGK